MKRTKIKHLLEGSSEIPAVTVAGWVRTKRDSKAFSFIEINDGSGPKNLQVIADSSLPNYESDIKKLTIGCSVVIEGALVKSPAKGQAFEMKAASVKVLGWADPAEYPLQKKETSLEFLREQAYLRPRTNLFGSVFRIRSALAFAIHNFYREREFFYVHTPIITASDCEGAGQMFKVTTLDLDRIPRDKSGRIDFASDFFGKASYLTVSGQLEGELFATAIGDIYTFGPTFRAENSNTARHASEFWMIEPEMAFYDLEDDMQLAEDFVKYLIRFVLENHPDDMEYFDKNVEPGLVEKLKLVMNSNFKRVPYTEAIAILEKSGKQFEFPVKWGIDMQAEHERYLTEQHFKGPIIVYNYPKEIKAFYMKQNDDGKTVRAMDVLVPGVGEIIGGSQREDDLQKLTSRINEMGMSEKDYWWYLNIRRWGSVPHAGFGLGFERALMYITGMKNIRDVVPFSRTPKNAEF
jgi:asparaginyl-tRNA synthetase